MKARYKQIAGFHFVSSYTGQVSTLQPVLFLTHDGATENMLSHNSPCFQCNIFIMNFLVSYMCGIRFLDVTDCTVNMFRSMNE